MKRRLTDAEREAMRRRLAEIWEAAAEDRDLRELNLTPDEWQMVVTSGDRAADQLGEFMDQRDAQHRRDSGTRKPETREALNDRDRRIVECGEMMLSHGASRRGLARRIRKRLSLEITEHRINTIFDKAQGLKK